MVFARPILGSIHHIALAVHNLEEAVAYYLDVLELPQLEPPASAAYANGIRWFDLGDKRALHLIEVPIDCIASSS